MKTTSTCSLSRPTRRRFLQATSLAAVGVVWTDSPGGGAESGGSAKGRRIGFVDDNLNNYHANVFLQALRGPLKERGFSVTGCLALQETDGRAWAEKNAVPFFTDPAALNPAVDFYMVLAPSKAEAHWDLCQRVFPFKKPTYVDKTFAPNLATAKRIFALADQHGTPVHTSSALRYTNVQEEAKKLASAKVEHMITWGGGGSFDEYAVHPLELLVSVMGPEATNLMRRGPENRAQLLVNFAGDRTGVVNIYPGTNTPFAASLTTPKATKYIEVDGSKMFINNQAAVLDFFLDGKPNIDRRESLTIMSLLDAARDARARHEFIPLA